MEKKSFEQVIEDGVRLLERYIPQTYLYFPLLSSAIVWAIRRRKEWEEKIFAWEVWIEPESVKEKPSGFVVSFFKNHPALSWTFAKELDKNDIASLRDAFRCLYPVVGLEEPFLSALFQAEVKSEDYRKIVRDFEARVRRAKRDMDAVKGHSGLLRDLKVFAEEMVSFGKDYLLEKDVQKAVAEILKKKSDNDRK
jgi:hypothetical protein